MKKFIENFKRYYRAYLIYGAVFAVIGVGIFLLFFYLGDKSLQGATNGIGWSALALFFLGCLILLSNYGAYDFLSYGFQQMFSSMFSKNPNKYHDYVEYRDEKNKKRSSGPRVYMAAYFVDVLFIIATIALEIVYHASM